MLQKCAILCSIFVVIVPTNAQNVTKSKQELILAIYGSNASTEAIPLMIDLQPHNSNHSNGSCKCISYFLCDNGTINTDGSDIFNPRVDDGDCHYLEACCTTNITSVGVGTTPKPPPETREKENATCGYRNEFGIGFRLKTNENEAEYGEFPWMVAILVEIPKTESVGYKCGGTLIHPQVVLTAAHCVNDKNITYRIRAGEWDTQTQKEQFPYQDRAIQTIILHPHFNAKNLHNGVALIFLKEPLNIEENVNVACLPPQNTISESKDCFSSGWGKDEFGKKGQYAVILKKIELPVIGDNPCQEALRNTRLGEFFLLHDSFMCAGGEKGKDVCKGDGGSPLVCPIPGQAGRFYQIGIVAWGIGCGEDGVPGVYVDVAHFRDWIDEQMGLQELDTLSYQY